ncbi:MAG: hypothetical protein JWM12_3295 [Ilumatobacteraceae bacterium]|nr:hypothetical protein [Ilumatobacteraceae bacterium]
MEAQRAELPKWECLNLLRSRAVGRMCLIEHGCPLAMPINYKVVGMDDDIQIVVLTAPETMLGRYEGPGSLEVDDIDLDHGTAWSVIVRGVLQRESASNDLPNPRPLVTQGRNRWIGLHATAISGRRFTVTTAADGIAVEWQLAG